MRHRKKQCILWIVLIFSCLLFGCGHSGKELSPPSVQNHQTVPPQTEPMAETALPETNATEAVQIPETTESAEATETTEQTAASEGNDGEMMYQIYQLELLHNPQSEDFVEVQQYIPDIYIELKYALTDNFTGERIYDFESAYLRYGTVMKLQKVCEVLKEQGYYLKIWDAYRPSSAQFRLWEICPDSRYVADPNRGFSNHTRGNALDVTLVDAWGRELPMPTGFDDFSDAANRDYRFCSEEARHNALLLETVMEENGFQGYWGEWWHFSDTAKYEPETVFDPGEISVMYPDCNEFISLRERASGYSDVLDKIYLGSPLTVLGYTGQFALAQYNGQRGYVLRSYIRETP